MQLRKQLDEYSIGGLISILALSDNDEQRAEITAELERRQRVSLAESEARRRNRAELQAIAIAAGAEGEVKKELATTKKANKELYLMAKAQAFESVAIPEGAITKEKISDYNRRLHQAAQLIYRDIRRGESEEERATRRARRQDDAKQARQKIKKLKRAEGIEKVAYRNLRYPFIGSAVYYTDLSRTTKQVGQIIGVVFRADICAFALKIETAQKTKVVRAIAAIEPVTNPEWFAEQMIELLQFEAGEKMLRECSVIRSKIDYYSNRLEILQPHESDYLNSDFRAKWFDRDEIARSFAKEIKKLL